MLKTIQAELPKLWTDELYSADFQAYPVKHRDFQHALIHIMKALGKLSILVEQADHGGVVADMFRPSEVRKYLADIVICTVRMAITNPGDEIDLEQAILDRIEEKMGVRIPNTTTTNTTQGCDQEGHQG